jgi:hypothetical protein
LSHPSRALRTLRVSRRHGRTPERLTDDVLGLYLVPEDERGDPRDLTALLLQRPGAGEGGRRADVLEPLSVTCLAHAAGEKRDVRSLTSAVRVELVEDEKAEILRSLDDRAVERPREHVFEHYVVREEDVGRRLEDRVSLLLILLPRVASVAHEVRRARRADREELLELAELAVCEGVHRIDNERLNAAPRAGPKHVVDDRDDVGQALPRAGARRQDVVAAAPGRLDRLALMAVQTKGLAVGILSVLVAAKDLAAALVQNAFVDKLIDHPAGLKGGV